MITVLADSTGELCEFANTPALRAFHAWAGAQRGVLGQFARQGWTEDLEELSFELEHITTPNELQEQQSLLLTAVGRAQDILIISDGEQQAELRTTSSSQKTLHNVADAHLHEMTLAVMYGFLKGRKAYRTDGIAGAVKAIRLALAKSLPPVLVKVYVNGARAGVKHLRTASLRTLKPQTSGQPHDVKGPFNLAFNVTDPNAVAWAEKHSAELIDGLTATSEQNIKDAVTAALEGNGLDEAYDEILAAVGDEARAEVIARTEIMTAANAGQQEGWEQAVEAGLLSVDIQVVWIAASGCCDDCDALDGETRDLNGKYDDPDAADGPPLHPNCRCTEGIAS